jgi:hypothetical protein
VKGARHCLLMLTAVSVNLELALLITSLRQSDPALMTGVVLAAFHSGYLVADQLTSRPPQSLRIVAVIGLVTTAIAFDVLGAPWVVLPVFVTSAAIQGLRRQLKSIERPRSSLKNVVKFVAMVSAGIAVLSWGIAILCSTAAVMVWIASRAARPLGRTSPGARRELDQRLTLALMVTEFLHHSHYFIYCYVFWRLIPGVQLGALGFLFSIGWLAYFVAEASFGRRHVFAPLLLGLGHMLCAGAVASMASTSTEAPMMLLWFVTGVGGGTAYMLANGPQAPRRERAEDWGHVAGTLTGGLIATLVGASVALVVAALTAVGVALAVGYVHILLRTDSRRPPCD